MSDSEGRVSSVRADKAGAVAAGLGVTAPAVVPVPEPERLTEPPAFPDRYETYPVIGPDGRSVTVTRNLDTGESSVS